MSRTRLIGGAVGAALSALLVAGCGQQRFTGAEMTGASLGAAAGGVLGYQMGGGLAQTLFTAGGVLLGGATGYMIGRRFEPSDRAMYGQTLAVALAGADDGETLHWRNPETGRNGTVRPVRSYHRGGDDRLCRDYRSAVNFEVDVATGSGTACRDTDGRWNLIAEAFG